MSLFSDVQLKAIEEILTMKGKKTVLQYDLLEAQLIKINIFRYLFLNLSLHDKYAILRLVELEFQNQINLYDTGQFLYATLNSNLNLYIKKGDEFIFVTSLIPSMAYSQIVNTEKCLIFLQRQDITCVTIKVKLHALLNLFTPLMHHQIHDFDLLVQNNCILKPWTGLSECIFPFFDSISLFQGQVMDDHHTHINFVSKGMIQLQMKHLNMESTNNQASFIQKDYSCFGSEQAADFQLMCVTGLSEVTSCYRITKQAFDTIVCQQIQCRQNLKIYLEIKVHDLTRVMMAQHNKYTRQLREIQEYKINKQDLSFDTNTPPIQKYVVVLNKFIKQQRNQKRDIMMRLKPEQFNYRSQSTNPEPIVVKPIIKKRGHLNRSISPITLNKTTPLNTLLPNLCSQTADQIQQVQRVNVQEYNRDRQQNSKVSQNQILSQYHDTIDRSDVSDRTSKHFTPMNATRNEPSKQNISHLPIHDYSHIVEQQDKYLIRSPLFKEFVALHDDLQPKRHKPKAMAHTLHKFLEFSKMLDKQLAKFPKIKSRHRRLEQI